LASLKFSPCAKYQRSAEAKTVAETLGSLQQLFIKNFTFLDLAGQYDIKLLKFYFFRKFNRAA
jgi:hypothetical protein